MSTEQTVPTLDAAYALRPSLLAPVPQRQPVFWLALAAAALVHAGLVVGLSRSAPLYLGDASGAAEAINVELVDEGELRSMSAPSDDVPPPPTFAAPAPSPAAEPAPPEPEPPAEAAPAQQSAALPTLDAEEPQASPPPDAVPKSAPKSAPKTEAAEAKPKEAPTETPKDIAKPEPTAKPVPKPRTPPAQLDLTVPFDVTMQGAADGGGASSTRPPGITRTGENDRFGRDVIRALKKTMPPSEGVTGKVKVRIFLDERGNVAWVRVVTGSGDRLLDDSVVFSVHQSSFPFPPKGATEADRTFLVTYIYR
jgi:TonB family protein